MSIQPTESHRVPIAIGIREPRSFLWDPFKQNKKLHLSMKLQTLFGCRVFFSWFQPEYSAVAKHTPGPDTRFFPAGLTGDGRKMEDQELMVAVLR
jgi:hypothetical protein